MAGVGAEGLVWKASRNCSKSDQSEEYTWPISR